MCVIIDKKLSRVMHVINCRVYCMYVHDQKWLVVPEVVGYLILTGSSNKVGYKTQLNRRNVIQEWLIYAYQYFSST